MNLKFNTAPWLHSTDFTEQNMKTGSLASYVNTININDSLGGWKFVVNFNVGASYTVVFCGSLFYSSTWVTPERF